MSKKPALVRLGLHLICRVLCAGVLIVAAPATGLAQQTAGENGEQDSGQNSATPNSGMTKQQLLSLIANEIVLAPGIGLRNVRLGEAMTTVRNRLGNPTLVTEEGLSGKRLNLTYRFDSGTSVVLSGRKILDRISVFGNASGLVRTSQGARFGMQSRVIKQIYKEPSKSRKSRLEYRQLGATFYLEEDRVNRIDLYPGKG